MPCVRVVVSKSSSYHCRRRVFLISSRVVSEKYPNALRSSFLICFEFWILLEEGFSFLERVTISPMVVGRSSHGSRCLQCVRGFVGKIQDFLDEIISSWCLILLETIYETSQSLSTATSFLACTLEAARVRTLCIFLIDDDGGGRRART